MKRWLSVICATALMAGAAAAAGDWTGPYAGFGIGNTDFDSSGALNGDGVTYGMHLGYDVDVGDFVLGGELEYDRTNITLGGGVAQADSIGRIKMRAGYDFGESLGYVILGGAQADTSVGSDTGVVFGLGFAVQLDGTIFISGEALTHRFDNFNGLGLKLDADSLALRASFRF